MELVPSFSFHVPCFCSLLLLLVVRVCPCILLTICTGMFWCFVGFVFCRRLFAAFIPVPSSLSSGVYIFSAQWASLVNTDGAFCELSIEPTGFAGSTSRLTSIGQGAFVTDLEPLTVCKTHYDLMSLSMVMFYARASTGSGRLSSRWAQNLFINLVLMSYC